MILEYFAAQSDPGGYRLQAMLANGQQLTATVRAAICNLDAASARGDPGSAAPAAPDTQPLENPAMRARAPSSILPRRRDTRRWGSRSHSPKR
eukprot:11898552-Heterocapsa_arctica.AAC.1